MQQQDDSSLLGERNRTKKRVYIYSMIPFIQNSRNHKLIYSDKEQTSGYLGTVGGVKRGRRKRLQRDTRNIWGQWIYFNVRYGDGFTAV